MKENLHNRLMVFFCFILFSNIMLIQPASGQLPGNMSLSRVGDLTTQSEREQEDNDINRRSGDLRKLESEINNKPPTFPSRPPRPRIKLSEADKEERRAMLREYEKIKAKLLPPKAYYIKYAELLKDEKMNLMRLFVDTHCNDGKIVSVTELENCAGVVPGKGGGSFYSFITGTNSVYTTDNWDINFIGDKFAVGNETIQTVISLIGNIDLKDINLKSKSLKFLNDYKPADTIAGIQEQNKILEKGIVFNEFTYSNQAPVNLNETYIVRSIAYKLKTEIRQRDNLERGIDKTISFTIVGQEKDGSLIILWKELRREFPRKKLK